MKNFILWAILALIWSSSYLAIKLGIQSISPLTLVALRMLIGTAILFAALRYRSLSLPFDVASWRVFLVSGVMGSILPFSLISYGEIYVQSGLSALLMGIAPVVTVLFAPLAHRDERLTGSAIAGISVGVLGLIVLIGPGALGGIGSHLSGQFAILGAALCYAFTTLYVRKHATHSALQMATGSMIVGTFIIVVLALLFEAPFAGPPPSQSSMLAVIYLGLFPTALATLIYFYLVPRIGAARLSQVNFVVPVAGALFGVALLGETLGSNAIISMLLILLAIYLVTRKTSAQI